MEHFLYATVELPPPPQWLLDHAYKLYIDRLSEIKYTDTRVLYKFEKKEKNALLIQHILNKESHEWALNEILNDTDYNNLTYVKYSKTNSVSSTLGAHRDLARNFGLMYLLSNGGNDTTTNFYKDVRGAPISIETTREPKDQDYIKTRIVSDYSLLEKIAEFKIKEGQWTIMNSSILHGVENLSSSRAAIQISLMKLPTNFNYINPIYYKEEQNGNT